LCPKKTGSFKTGRNSLFSELWTGGNFPILSTQVIDEEIKAKLPQGGKKF